MAYKRYKSVFSESSAVSSNSKLKMKERIRRILNEKELSKKDVESIVSKIETVITDVISGYGVDNSIVDELSGTVKNINAFASTMISQNDVMEEIQGMEESFRNKNRKLKENYMDMEMSQDSFYDEMPMEDSFEDDVFADEYSMYENRLSKINKLKRKLREDLDEEEDMAEGEDMEEDMEEADDMEEGEEDIEEADMSAYDEAEDEEDDDEEDEDEKKESRFRRRNFRYSEEESEHGDDLIPSEEGSDYDFLSGVDDMGNTPSDRGMEADYDTKQGM